VSGNRVIAGLANGKLVALDINNGKKIWETTIAVARGRSELERIVDIDGAIRIKDGLVYVVSYQGRLSAVDVSNGRISWVRDLSSYQDIEISDAHIYITDNLSKIWALDRRSGATLWRQDKLSGRTLTAPVIQSDYLAIGDFNGFVHWISREDGHLVARQDMESASTAAKIVGSVQVEEHEVGGDFDFKEIAGVLSTPLAVGNMLYVSDKGGVLAAYQIGNKL
jgi:outer membrane protein assembly factor BamB